MIVEHELIEQIESNEGGRPLAWVCDLISTSGPTDSFDLLAGMWKAGHIVFADSDGIRASDWAVAELIRLEDGNREINVVAKDSGCEWVHGR